MAPSPPSAPTASPVACTKAPSSGDAALISSRARDSVAPHSRTNCWFAVFAVTAWQSTATAACTTLRLTSRAGYCATSCAAKASRPQVRTSSRQCDRSDASSPTTWRAVRRISTCGAGQHKVARFHVMSNDQATHGAQLREGTATPLREGTATPLRKAYVVVMHAA